MTKFYVAPLLVAVGLSACGEFESRTGEAERGLDDVRGTGFTQTANLPSGQATYEGTSVFAPNDVIAGQFGDISRDLSGDEASDVLEGITDEAILASDATLTADFDNATISGELTDFIDSDDNEFSGTVDIINVNAGGAPNITDDSGNAVFEIGLDGTITDDDGVDTQITGFGEGAFAGDDADGLLAGVGAAANGGISESLTGYIVGTRD